MKTSLAPFLNKLKSNVFFQGGVWLTAASFAGNFINYLFSVLTGRALGPEGYGEISAMFSYTVLITFPVGVLGALLIQKIGNSEDSDEYTASILLWAKKKATQWWYLLLLPILVTPFVPSLTNLSPYASYTLVVVVIVTLIGSLYDGIFQGKHLFAMFSIISIVAVLIKLMGGVLAFYYEPLLVFPLAAIMISGIVKVVWSHIYLTHKIQLTRHTREINKRVRDLLVDRQFWLTLLTSAGIIGLSNIDIIFVKKMFSAEHAGLYSAWSLFAKIILYLIGPILSLSYVFFSSRKNKHLHKLVLSLTISGMMVVSFIMYQIYDDYPQTIIHLIFGSRFDLLIPYLDWAALFGSAYVLIMFFNNYYLAKGSRVAMILPFAIIIYIASLFVWGKDIYTVMMINVGFSISVVIVYLVFYLRERLTNLAE